MTTVQIGVRFAEMPRFRLESGGGMNAKRAFTGATHIVYDVLWDGKSRRMSINQIMSQTGYTAPNTIIRAIAILEENGIVKRHSGGRGKAYIYELVR
jgi:hypothetical protein